MILSFGHEMNGHWYTWGDHHTSPRVFVSVWRHIVRIFHASGAKNVTWLWTVNIMTHAAPGARAVPDPAAWWPEGLT